MNKKYFENVNTLEELLKHHHPDNGGNVSDMQEINAEYDKLFKVLKEHHNNAKQGDIGYADSEYSKNMYDCENDKALRDILNKIIHFTGIDIKLVGQWVRMSGNTYAYKKELKGIGFRWASLK